MAPDLPTVTIVGRPNVGKSTLFNRLARGRKSIVVDVPNATRDWLESDCAHGETAFRLVDTAGMPGPDTEYAGALRETAQGLVERTDLVLFVVDARVGLHPVDREILDWLRKVPGPGRVLLVVNKTEGRPSAEACAEFHALGFPGMAAISASRGDNVRGLLDLVAGRLGGRAAGASGTDGGRTSMVFVGRTNVGKSSLVNAMLGQSRMIVSDTPGTTRDSVEVVFEHGGRRYTLIDTAGLRRRTQVRERVEQAATSRTVDAVKRANVSLCVLDASGMPSAQDRKIIRLVSEAGQAMVFVLNKWDLVDPRDRRKTRRAFARELSAHPAGAPVATSAISGRFRASDLLGAVDLAHRDATRSFSTAALTRALREVLKENPPPISGKVRPKLRYAHQGGNNPVSIVIHGNALDRIGDDYRRYLARALTRQLGMEGAAPKLLFRQAENPYA